MASSTTSPTASTIASSVSVLIVKPNAYMMKNAPVSATGMVISGMMVARRLRRKKKMTMATSTTASPMVENTALIDCAMNTELS